MGSSLVQIKESGYLFGGKSLESKRGLTLFKYDEYQQTVNFETIKNSNCEIFNRYGQLAHEFEGKIVIIGGESSYTNGSNNIRTLLGDLLFYDPQSHKHQAIQFIKPIRKVRAMASCILGKYLYYYGGLLENGEVVNDLIKINLSQNPKSPFKWRSV